VDQGIWEQRLGNKDKKARRAALRDVLLAIPGALHRASASLGWLVVLAGFTLVALIVYLAFGRASVQRPLPGGQQDNPAATLFVRDLGRLADGRHTFDLVYEVVLRNPEDRSIALAFTLQRLLIGDPPPDGAVVDLGDAPGAFGPASGAWHQAAFVRRIDRNDEAAMRLAPGHWRALRTHYRIQARPDQFADVAIGYDMDREPRGWFAQTPRGDGDAHDEPVQLGAVLRAHCPLGVKVHNGELRSLCGS